MLTLQCHLDVYKPLIFRIANFLKLKTNSSARLFEKTIEHLLCIL